MPDRPGPAERLAALGRQLRRPPRRDRRCPSTTARCAARPTTGRRSRPRCRSLRRTPARPTSPPSSRPCRCRGSGACCWSARAASPWPDWPGARMVEHKIGQRHVQGRTKAGGQSQQRFARRRDNQARQAYEAAADHAARILRPGPLVDRRRPRRRSTRCWPTRGCAGWPWSEPWLPVPDPRRAVLDQAIAGRAGRSPSTSPTPEVRDPRPTSASVMRHVAARARMAATARRWPAPRRTASGWRARETPTSSSSGSPRPSPATRPSCPTGGRPPGGSGSRRWRCTGSSLHDRRAAWPAGPARRGGRRGHHPGAGAGRRTPPTPACSSPAPSAGSPDAACRDVPWLARAPAARAARPHRAARRLADPRPDDPRRRRRPPVAAPAVLLARSTSCRRCSSTATRRPANLPGRDGDDVVAIDWGDLGTGPVGHDLGLWALTVREDFEPLLAAYADGPARPRAGDAAAPGARITAVYTALSRARLGAAPGRRRRGRAGGEVPPPERRAVRQRRMQRQATQIEALLG